MSDSRAIAAGGARLPAAAWPRSDPAAARLLRVDPALGTIEEGWIRDLPGLLRAGDLLVLNDAATLPASFRGRSRRGPVEMRLLGPPLDEHEGRLRWNAVLFGPGSWRQRTENRPPPPALGRGERIDFRGGAPPYLRAEITSVSALSPRLVEVVFDLVGDALWSALLRRGRPVQYAHVSGPLSLDLVQTPFAGRPWAAEMPSAGLPLTLDVLGALRGRRIGVALLSHAAGLSSTGDVALDALLPLPERTDIPVETVRAVERATSRGGRVVAVGTTVVRALEGRVAEEGRLRPGPSLTRLRIGSSYRPRVVDGLLSGLHERGESHFELLRAFAPAETLDRAIRRAQEAGFLGHDFGDHCLILPPGGALLTPRITLHDQGTRGRTL